MQAKPKAKLSHDIPVGNGKDVNGQSPNKHPAKSSRVAQSGLSSVERLKRGMRLLLGTVRPKHTDILLPDICISPDGYEYDVYHPRGKALRTVLVVYGMTILGREDVRLVRFARACVDNGLRVIMPHLPGLMDFEISRQDMQRLESIVRCEAAHEQEQLGLVGFSTGGSYSLLLAADPTLRGLLGPIVLFSPIYDIRDVFERLHAVPKEVPKTDKDWDQFIWAQYVIAFRNRNLLELPEAVVDALRILLAEYDEMDIQVKKIFYKNHIQALKLTSRSGLVNEGQVLDQLSARGHLAEVKSPVFILHDATDHLVPPDHTRLMHKELAKRGMGLRQRMLVTLWLSHVIVQTSGNPLELYKMIDYLGELFRVGV